ncbi:YhgE/Pip domain-containing protein [Dermabacter hominis]|uniref:YhgE/Pip domain-containing protein n=1 Tax=Dermabacter TaxID=36739 RepID=UPI0021A5FF04|nr:MULTISPECIES: YhgE/Pip domain-containing protein [Dermabacter]MCT1708334.1 YhgE/Pip domain-containing protein [Dermabacter hominis]MCT2055570.1 YhgE/Pip domain-containing protein [Dermabacter hominis]MCT2082948.1 YhgE/Pip domain-containing protein [Dermabacter hominis]MCT2091180.1 YhgE/Pip domain-containing protein [Dermabacter hominis]MCT2190041.1 YhgE/Pip domain-containing protein [Dermabacter hominis]
MKTLARFPKPLLIVVLLPLLVASVGIWALKDRAEGFENVPAAVVNLDEGTEMEVDGKTQTVPFGRLLAGALTQPGTMESEDSDGSLANLDSAGFDWQLTTQKDAESGLENGTYSAVVVIPKDFSDDVATMGKADARQATVIVNTNDSSGMLDSMVGQAITQVIASEFNGTMAKQYLDGVYVGFNSLKDGFTKSADGAGELSDGAHELADGAKGLDDGAGKLATGVDELNGGVVALDDGAGELADGVRGLDQGTKKLSDGAHKLTGGTGALASGTDDLSGGADDLSNGLGALSDGAHKVSGGVAQLSEGLNGTDAQPGLRQGAEKLASAVNGDGSAENPGLAEGAQQLAEGLDQYASGLPQAQEGLTQGLQHGIDQAFDTGRDGQPGFAESMNTLAASCTELEQAFSVDPRLSGDPRVAGLEDMCSGLTQMSEEGVNGVRSALSDHVVPKAVDTVFEGDGSRENPGLTPSAQKLADGAMASADAAPQLVDGINQLNGGIAKLGDGAAQLAPGATQVADGVDASRGGAAQLADGAAKLSTGAAQVDEGAKGLAEGTSELSSGTGQLADGADELANGTSKLATGTAPLSEGAHGLAEGTTQLSDGTRRLADGSRELWTGLRDGADQVPSYSESERTHLAEVSTKAVTLSTSRENEADGGAVATFPFVAALGLWLGAFGIFLVWPALRERFLNSALPMWRVALLSLLWPLVLAALQALLVIGLLVVFGVPVASLASVAAITIAAALCFAIVHQMLLTVFGARVGRVVSIIVLVLQVVSLVGILPLESAPSLLQSLTAFMPLTVASQGLVSAALGGAIVSTGTTLAELALFAAVSFAVTLVFSRGARRVKPSSAPRQSPSIGVARAAG